MSSLLKFWSDTEVEIYVDGEHVAHLSSNSYYKHVVRRGDYDIKIVASQNNNFMFESEYHVEDDSEILIKTRFKDEMDKVTENIELIKNIGFYVDVNNDLMEDIDRCFLSKRDFSYIQRFIEDIIFPLKYDDNNEDDKFILENENLKFGLYDTVSGRIIHAFSEKISFIDKFNDKGNARIMTGGYALLLLRGQHDDPILMNYPDPELLYRCPAKKFMMFKEMRAWFSFYTDGTSHCGIHDLISYKLEGGRCGIFNIFDGMKIPMIYSDIYLYDNNAIVVKAEAGLYGIIDEDSRFIVNPAFTDVHFKADSKLVIFKNIDGRWGAFNPNGKLVVIFDYAKIIQILPDVYLLLRNDSEDCHFPDEYNDSICSFVNSLGEFITDVNGRQMKDVMVVSMYAPEDGSGIVEMESKKYTFIQVGDEIRLNEHNITCIEHPQDVDL
ncbi:MAG: hypothetical protein NC411_07980 [Bacteroides sp.]|nr:hypothetical protein [Bacteroides sp.]